VSVCVCVCLRVWCECVCVRFVRVVRVCVICACVCVCVCEREKEYVCIVVPGSNDVVTPQQFIVEYIVNTVSKLTFFLYRSARKKWRLRHLLCSTY